MHSRVIGWVAVSEEDDQANRFTPIEELPWQEETLFVGWLKDVSFPMSIVRQVFTNKDGSTGILYLACSDTTMKRGQILATYQKRWPVEVFHKSLKQNAALGKAPVRRVITQNNHVFAVLYAVFQIRVPFNKATPQSFCFTRSVVSQSYSCGLR